MRGCWLSLRRLRDEEGWTQERIAGAKGVDRSFVSLRQKLHGLPDNIKRHVNQKTLTEAHLIEISGLLVDSQLSGCLTTEEAWEEVAALAVHGRGKNGEKSVRAVRDDVSTYGQTQLSALPRFTYPGLHRFRHTAAQLGVVPFSAKNRSHTEHQPKPGNGCFPHSAESLVTYRMGAIIDGLRLSIIAGVELRPQFTRISSSPPPRCGSPRRSARTTRTRAGRSVGLSSRSAVRGTRGSAPCAPPPVGR